MELLKTISTWALLLALYAAAVVLLGAWAKGMFFLFCVGYGC